jgi:hypothetical protein
MNADWSVGALMGMYVINAQLAVRLLIHGGSAMRYSLVGVLNVSQRSG